MSTPLSGGYCGGVPPLPIPNREVKPTCADGTAMQCGRVGSRLFSYQRPWREISEVFFVLSGLENRRHHTVHTLMVHRVK